MDEALAGQQIIRRLPAGNFRDPLKPRVNRRMTRREIEAGSSSGKDR
jgi:hypothetical protein